MLGWTRHLGVRLAEDRHLESNNHSEVLSVLQPLQLVIFNIISLVETLLKVKTLLLSPVTSVFFNEQEMESNNSDEEPCATGGMEENMKRDLKFWRFIQGTKSLL
ncbi:hypothetical protein TURU_056477 [Turdus rufiventris]|nr:hypothetical protein TURU_056477 [Turdus rufiventris]